MKRVRIVIMRVEDDLDVAHRVVVAEAQRPDGRVIQFERRRVAEQFLREIVGVLGGGIGLTRANGTAGRNVDGRSRNFRRLGRPAERGAEGVLADRPDA
jgi:hypothetical protein